MSSCSEFWLFIYKDNITNKLFPKWEFEYDANTSES